MYSLRTLANGMFLTGYYKTILASGKKTAHTANILVELCVYSSTVNKRDASSGQVQRNAADVNEYLFKAQLFQPL